jgi:AraC-like DNA-binding protein
VICAMAEICAMTEYRVMLADEAVPARVRPSRRMVRGGHAFPRHAHAGWSVALVIAGTGYFRCRDESYVAGPGAITVLHPGEAHESWVDREHGLDYTVFDLDVDAAAGFHGRRTTPTFPARVIDDRRCRDALWAAQQRHRDGDDLEADVVLAVALQELYQRHGGAAAAAGTGPSGLVGAVKEYLEEHVTEHVTLAAVAAHAGVSPATVVRRFRAETGLPPHEYLVSRRVDRARALLAAGAGVAETASRTGFADQSHLHRHFTRILGVTPGRFRGQR